MKQSAPYVFLSYASADRDRALHIADLLETRGVSVWIDRKSISGGASWSAEIVRGIRECAVLVVTCSKAAMTSPNVQQEIQLAWETRRPILPLLLEPVEPPDTMRYALAGRQWIEILEQPDAAWLIPVLRALRDLGIAFEAESPVVQPVSPDAPVPGAIAPPPRHNLPGQLTSFIGREREIAEVKERLASTRLLTLTGTGGCGKTRLALQVAAELIATFPEGVWLIELAPLTDPALVAETVASALDIPEEANRPILATLLDALRSRRLLLILDNCEHLIDTCARLADAILRSCPETQILATSREALGIAGEVSWRVPSLAVPVGEAVPSLDELIQNESVRLFLERARAALPGFALTSQNAGAVAQICQRLDGIPLALELAVVRLKGLSAEQVAARLAQRFRLLTGGSRAALPRQQTLAALVGWSYDLLSEPEQFLFNRLGVFVGGFTLEAAEAVCSDDGVGGPGTSKGNPTPETQHLIPGEDVLDLLLRLVEKSLVVAEPGDEGADRYRLLETLRQYALEKLAAGGEAEALHGLHAAYYLALAEEAVGEFFGPQLPLWYARMQRELNNLRAALRWAIDAGEVEQALRLCGALGHYLYNRSWPGESWRWLAELLANPAASQPTVGRGRALVSAGRLAWDQLEPDQADTLLNEALDVLRACGDQSGISEALEVKARVAIVRGNYANARALAEEALAVA